MNEEYTPTHTDVLVACETLLRAGYTPEALSVLASIAKPTDKVKAQIRELMLEAAK
jgi:hypothetical protein